MTRSAVCGREDQADRVSFPPDVTASGSELQYPQRTARRVRRRKPGPFRSALWVPGGGWKRRLDEVRAAAAGGSGMRGEARGQIPAGAKGGRAQDWYRRSRCPRRPELQHPVPPHHHHSALAHSPTPPSPFHFLLPAPPLMFPPSPLTQPSNSPPDT